MTWESWLLGRRNILNRIHSVTGKPSLRRLLLEMRSVPIGWTTSCGTRTMLVSVMDDLTITGSSTRSESSLDQRTAQRNQRSASNKDGCKRLRRYYRQRDGPSGETNS